MPEINIPEGWETRDGGDKLRLTVDTGDFLTAVDLVDEIAPLAEAQDHHPDLHIEGYNTLRIDLWSHDVGTLTERDETLAGAITDLLEKRGLL